VETASAVQAQFGRLDFTVANAGISDAGMIGDYPFERWRRVMSVNLDGVFLTLKTAIPLIKAGGLGGSIVVVSSVAGVKAEPGVGAYGASKAAVVQLAKVAAKEGAADRIRVNAILPGGVETPIWRDVPFFQDLVKQHGSEAAAFEAMAGMATPLGRYARAEEVASQIVHLLSDASAMITGAAVVMDGGYSL
jgi:NAD(P)-dependent dehydrogenase (short-subunit alcohol dehydrogenase family)